MKARWQKILGYAGIVLCILSMAMAAHILSASPLLTEKRTGVKKVSPPGSWRTRSARDQYVFSAAIVFTAGGVAGIAGLYFLLISSRLEMEKERKSRNSRRASD